MKIIFLNSHPIEYFSDLYRYLVNKNLDIEAWYCSDYGLNNYYDKEFNIDRKVDGLISGFKYKFLFNLNPYTKAKEKFFDTINPFILFNLFKLKKDTIIICHGWSRLSMILTILFAKYFGIKVGIRSETPYKHENHYKGFKKILRNNILKFLFRQIDYFFYIGSDNYKFYKQFKIPENRLIFMPYSVNPRNNNYSYKKRLNKILFCGKLIDKKRPIDLLKAFSNIDNIKSELIFAGNGIQLEYLKSKAREYAIKHRVHFLGLQSRKSLDKLYQQADVLVLPSGYGETWGLVINEGLEWGVPVIVSDMVGCSQDLCNKNGYIFKYLNIKDLTNKLNKIYKINDNQYQSLTKESFVKKQKFSFQTITNNLIRFTKEHI